MNKIDPSGLLSVRRLWRGSECRCENSLFSGRKGAERRTGAPKGPVFTKKTGFNKHTPMAAGSSGKANI